MVNLLILSKIFALAQVWVLMALASGLDDDGILDDLAAGHDVGICLLLLPAPQVTLLLLEAGFQLARLVLLLLEAATLILMRLFSALIG